MNHNLHTSLWKAFEEGFLKTPTGTVNFADIPWSEHPSFEGVALKHIVTAKDTCGQFSCHLVRIAPDCRIGNHIHETQLETHEVISGAGTCVNDGVSISYAPGTVSIMPAGIPHEVNAGKDGLCLFAKFFPALC